MNTKRICISFGAILLLVGASCHRPKANQTTTYIPNYSKQFWVMDSMGCLDTRSRMVPSFQAAYFLGKTMTELEALLGPPIVKENGEWIYFTDGKVRCIPSVGIPYSEANGDLIFRFDKKGRVKEVGLPKRN